MIYVRGFEGSVLYSVMLVSSLVLEGECIFWKGFNVVGEEVLFFGNYMISIFKWIVLVCIFKFVVGDVVLFV